MRLLVVFLSLTLTACGFHLRDSYHIPLALQEITLISSASPLDSILRQRLQQSNVDTSGGEYTLEITQDTLSKQTTNTDTRAKTAEYNLYYQVSYTIKDKQNRLLMPKRQLLLRRGYQYDNTAIVGKSSEEQTLIQELYQDAATQIVNQLRSVKPVSSATP
ncbi:MAG: hypothetical protein H6996_00330 [Moraxellaceae bacterium]|nr:hypothetical protein [Pseudomonadales bacterium]MCP5173531.1 hypothetical protein [Moraxellaceae bacterium]MCP5177806.1 hypothetical protein [Moraxellaceae bacterium]HQV21953.1 LPS assembly lipoprotein LptE [Agitococcus sp.]